MTKCKRARLLENKDKFCLDICKHYEVKSRWRRVERRVKSKGFKYAEPNTKRYLELHNGDIYDVDSNTILNRKELLKMLA
ncbi:hypothetical protein LCGC14_1770180 [marine sediment metagenome]|uniref:Uncharacterized protein n=1 Tax=marine sediment metagenome TaxID=412755 RepID=A0A0F9GYJ4_9ZZZZ